MSGMPVTNTPTCSSRIDPHRVESDSSDFFRGRGPAGRNPTDSIARWREGKLPHSVDLNAQRYWMARIGSTASTSDRRQIPGNPRIANPAHGEWPHNAPESQ